MVLSLWSREKPRDARHAQSAPANCYQGICRLVYLRPISAGWSLGSHRSSGVEVGPMPVMLPPAQVSEDAFLLN
jgi:hypothetical protein